MDSRNQVVRDLTAFGKTNPMKIKNIKIHFQLQCVIFGYILKYNNSTAGRKMKNKCKDRI